MAARSKRFQSLGFYAVAWIEHFLVHGPGDVQGQLIELDDEFATFVLKSYEVDDRGYRKVRRAFLSRAKGRSKSGLAAMIECFEALGECRFDHWAEPGEVSDWGYAYEVGEPVGRQLTYVEALNVATEESQAGNTYDGVYYMLNPDTCSMELLDRFGRIDVGLTRINLPNSRGFIEPVTASNESKDGGKSTFIVADETHLWVPPAAGVFKLGKMHQTMVRNLLKRKEASGWMLETSTMYAEGEFSVAEGTHAYATANTSSGKLLFDHRQASDHWDLNKRAERVKALREAYGPAAAWMDLNAIADYWDDPQATEAEFKRFWLNQPVPLVDPHVIDQVRWGSAPLLNPEAPQPECVALVVDVSPDRAWSTIGVAGGIVDDKTLVMCFSGRGTDWVAGKIADLVARRKVLEVALFTGGQAKGLQPDLVKVGVEFEKLSGVDMGAACSAFQEAIKAGSVVHLGQPELDTAVANARTRFYQSGETEVWDRRDQKIDISPLVACSGAFYRWGLLKPDPAPQIHEWPDEEEISQWAMSD